MAEQIETVIHETRCGIESRLLFCNEMVFDKQTNNLYLYGRRGAEYQIDVINVMTKSHESIKNVPIGEYFLLIDGMIHIINNQHNHCIGTIENGSFVTIQSTLTTVPDYRSSGGKAIFIPSKKSILLIGGINLFGKYQQHPWIYSLVTQKWREIKNVPFECVNFCAVLSSNQRYVLIFGGHKPHKEYTHIDVRNKDTLVLDIKYENRWVLKKSKIYVPNSIKTKKHKLHKPRMHVVRTGGVDSNDEKLVVGYIRDCFKQKEFESIQLPPKYLMKMIEKRYNAETLHWFDGDGHWGIYLKDILNSLQV